MVLKRVLLLILGICFITTPAFAQNRGALPGIFASWYSVTTTQTTITFPFNSRDIAIHNGSTVGICVSLKGEEIPPACVSEGDPNTPTIFQLDGNTALNLRDYITGSISFESLTGTASPVSVVVTY